MKTASVDSGASISTATDSTEFSLSILSAALTSADSLTAVFGSRVVILTLLASLLTTGTGVDSFLVELVSSGAVGTMPDIIASSAEAADINASMYANFI
jgi:hypothetical protein